MAKRSGHYDDEGRPKGNSTNSCVLSFIYVSIFSCAVVFCYTRYRSSLRSDVQSIYHQEFDPWNKLPIHPPSPYSYPAFMTWLKETNFKSIDGLKWTPEVNEFDLDAAANGAKYGPWLKGKQADSALSVTKKINKFLFMDDIILNGDLTVIGGPGTHLYVLTRLLAAAEGVRHATFVDAGCGTGYLLMAWALAAGEGSRAVGIEADAATVFSAKRHLSSPDALASHTNVPLDAKMDVQMGDALRPDASALALKPGTVDAINVGFAVYSLDELAPLAYLLRNGGLLAAPICVPIEKAAKDVPEGRCDSRFQIFQKSSDGKLRREAGDPDIPVRFIVAASSHKNLRGK